MRKVVIVFIIWVKTCYVVVGQNDCSVRSNMPLKAEKLIVSFIEQDSAKDKLYFARVQLSEQRNSFRIWVQRYDDFPEALRNYLNCNQKRILVQGYSIGYFTNEEFFLDEMLFCDTCPHSNQLVSPPYLYIEMELKPPKKLGKVIGHYQKQ